MGKIEGRIVWTLYVMCGIALILLPVLPWLK